MSYLPIDIIFEICLVADDETLCALFGTCKQVCALSQNEILWKNRMGRHHLLPSLLRVYERSASEREVSLIEKVVYTDFVKVTKMYYEKNEKKFYLEDEDIFSGPHFYLYYMVFASKAEGTLVNILEWMLQQQLQKEDFRRGEFFTLVTVGAIYGKKYDALKWVESYGEMEEIFHEFQEMIDDIFDIFGNAFNFFNLVTEDKTTFGDTFNLFTEDETTLIEKATEIEEFYRGCKFESICGREGLEYFHEKGFIENLEESIQKIKELKKF